MANAPATECASQRVQKDARMESKIKKRPEPSPRSRDPMPDKRVERIKAMRNANIAKKKRPAPRPAPASVDDPHHHRFLPVNGSEKAKELRRRLYAAGAERLANLAQQINTAHEAAQAAAKTAIERAIECGKLLLKAKTEVGHGEWTAWVAATCVGLGLRQCQKYMQLARHIASNTNHESYSSIREATAEIAVPRLPRPEPDELDLIEAFRVQPAATHDQMSAALKGRQDATELLDALRREIARWGKANAHRPRSWIVKLCASLPPRG